MTIKIISAEDWNKGYSIQGSLDGSFAEAQEYLRWVLTSRHTDNAQNFKNAIKVFTDKWNMPEITTKYFKSLGNVDNKITTQRISRVMKQAGFSTIPTKRYYKTLRSVSHETKRLIFGKDINGKTTIQEEKTETVGRLTRCFIGESLHKIMSPEENKIRQQRFNELNLKMNILSEINKHKRLYHGVQEETTRQRKAINKLMFEKRGFTAFNCKGCNREIQVPIETERKNELIADIYQMMARDIKDGIYFCSSCKKERDEGKGWKETSIKEFLSDLYKKAKEGKSYIGFDYKDFYNDYSFNNKEISCGKAKEKIKQVLISLDLETKMNLVMNKGNIKIEVIKNI